jgi:hypothetical protein
MPEGGPPTDMPPPVSRGTVICGRLMPPVSLGRGRAALPLAPKGTAERMPATISSTVAGPPAPAIRARSIAGQRSEFIVMSCCPRWRIASRAAAPSSLRSTGEVMS